MLDISCPVSVLGTVMSPVIKGDIGATHNVPCRQIPTAFPVISHPWLATFSRLGCRTDRCRRDDDVDLPLPAIGHFESPIQPHTPRTSPATATYLVLRQYRRVRGLGWRTRIRTRSDEGT